MKSKLIIACLVAFNVYAGEVNNFSKDTAFSSAFSELFDSENAVANVISQRSGVKEKADVENIDKILLNLALRNAELTKFIGLKYKLDDPNVEDLQRKTDEVKQLKNLALALVKVCVNRELAPLLEDGLQEILKNALSSAHSLKDVLSYAVSDLKMALRADATQVSLKKILQKTLPIAADGLQTILVNVLEKKPHDIDGLKEILMDALGRSAHTAIQGSGLKQILKSVTDIVRSPQTQNIAIDGLKNILLKAASTATGSDSKKQDKTFDSLQDILKSFIMISEANKTK